MVHAWEIFHRCRRGAREGRSAGGASQKAVKPAIYTGNARAASHVGLGAGAVASAEPSGARSRSTASLAILRRLTRALRRGLSHARGSRFRRNFTHVAKANFAAQVLSIAVAPALTRLYTPADYGAVAIYSSLLSILLSFATLRFDWSVPNAASRTRAAALIVLGGAMLVLMSATALVVFWLFASEWTFWAGFTVVRPYLPLLAIALVGGGLHQLMQAWFIREGSLAAVSRTKITRSVAGTAMSLIGGILHAGAWGLIISSVLSAWVGIGTLVRHARGLRASLARLSAARLFGTFRRFRREAVLSTLCAVINTASLTITPLLLIQFYSSAELGSYSLMHRLAVAPVGLFTSALAQSFWAESTTLVRSDVAELNRLYLRFSGVLALLAIPIVIVCLVGPFFTGVLFGQKWGPAGYILAALAPFLFGNIVVSPLSHLIVHRKQHWQASWDIARFLLVFVALLILGKMQAPIALTVSVTSGIMMVMYALLFWLNLRAIAEARQRASLPPSSD